MLLRRQKRPGTNRGDDAHSGGIHHLDVPMLAQSPDHPPANHVGGEKKGEADRREQAVEGAVQENHFSR